MKHTSRKKMLLSSIAMLLVAMMALGSATFAWFTNDPTADAKGLKAYTTSGTGLLVLSKTHETAGGDFSHHTILNAVKDGADVITSTTSKLLTPASISNSEIDAGNLQKIGNFYTVAAAKDDAYNQNKDKNITTSAGYYSEEIMTKVTGGAQEADLKLTGVKWNVTEGYTLCSAVRVAVTDTEGNLIAIFAPTAANNGYLASTTVADTNPTYTATPKGSCDIKAGKANKDGSTSINVYVYLDGEDESCYSLNVSSTLADVLNNLEIDLAVDAE